MIDLGGFAYDMTMFGSGLAVGAYMALKLKPSGPGKVIPAELLPVDVVSPPEPRRSEPRSSSPPRRVSEYAPKPKLARARFERLAAAPPPQRPQSTEAAVSARLPHNEWKRT